VEERFLGEAIATLGQRDAEQSIAWALTRVFLRGKGLGLVTNNAMPFPFKQQDIADALGLSLVHTNKTLGKLKSRQLAMWSDGTLRIPDVEQLAECGLVDDLSLAVRPII